MLGLCPVYICKWFRLCLALILMENLKPVCVWCILVICLFSKESCASGDALVICNNVFYIDIGKTEEISCEYPLSFQSVRWYRGTSSTPIALIDGGTKQVKGGYDINVSGALTINNATLEDEGNYTIFVLNALGGIERKTMSVHTKVSLATGPLLESCRSSSIQLCLNIDQNYRATTLACTTHGNRHAIKLEWYTAQQTDFTLVNETATEVSKDVNSSMFTSSSILSYDPYTFSLQIFKCKATGEVVKVPLDTTTLVEGIKKPSLISHNNISFEVNKRYNLRCSNSLLLIGQWKIVYHNETSRVLFEMYPGHGNGLCKGNERCTVLEDGSLEIRSVEISDEATYECTYFNGYEDGLNVINITVTVKPNPSAIVIESCPGFNECSINVNEGWALTASVFGSRPPVDLMCNEMNVTNSGGILSNGESATKRREDNVTFDVTYTVVYDVPTCNVPVHVVCQVAPGSYHATLPPVDIYLTAGECDESSKKVAIIVAMVIVFMVLIGAVITALVLRRKKGMKDSRLKSIKEEHHTDEEAVPLKQQTNFRILLQELCEKHGKVSKEEYQELSQHRESLSKISVEEFIAILSNSLKNEGISQNTFVHITGNLFITKQLPEGKLLTSVYTLLQDKTIKREDLAYMIMQYSMLYKMDIKIVSKEDENKEGLVMLTYPYYLQEIHTLIKKGQHDFKLYQRFEDILKKKINRKGLSIFEKNKSDLEEDPYEIISIRKEENEKRSNTEDRQSQHQKSQEGTVEEEERGSHNKQAENNDDQEHLYQFVTNSPKEDNGQNENHHFDVIKELKTKQSEQIEEENDIYDNADEDDDEDTMKEKQRFNKKAGDENAENERITDMSFEGIENISIVFVEALICSVNDNVLDHKDCETMLQAGITNRQIGPSECKTAFEECSYRGWISGSVQLHFLGQGFWINVITALVCMDKALHLLFQEKVKTEMFINWLSNCTEKGVMPKECFGQRVADHVLGKEIFWFYFILALKNTPVTETSLDPDLCRKVFDIVIHKSAVKHKKLKGWIRGMEVSKDDKNILLSYLKS